MLLEDFGEDNSIQFQFWLSLIQDHKSEISVVAYYISIYSNFSNKGDEDFENATPLGVVHFQLWQPSFTSYLVDEPKLSNVNLWKIQKFARTLDFGAQNPGSKQDRFGVFCICGCYYKGNFVGLGWLWSWNSQLQKDEIDDDHPYWVYWITGDQIDFSCVFTIAVQLSMGYWLSHQVGNGGLNHALAKSRDFFFSRMWWIPIPCCKQPGSMNSKGTPLSKQSEDFINFPLQCPWPLLNVVDSFWAISYLLIWEKIHFHPNLKSQPICVRRIFTASLTKTLNNKDPGYL